VYDFYSPGHFPPSHPRRLAADEAAANAEATANVGAAPREVVDGGGGRRRGVVGARGARQPVATPNPAALHAAAAVGGRASARRRVATTAVGLEPARHGLCSLYDRITIIIQNI
jgi:hypothetical protein